MGGASYAYDGAGNRISQTVGVDVTQYLLDLQPGLATVLQATQDSDTTRYIHAQRGIHAQQDASDNWTWMLQDGLGSVRSVVDDSLSVLESRLYEPYGTPFGASGTNQTVYGFTGEQTDANGQVYLRARYYNPSIGVFTGLDPFEGQSCTPMSLNGYSYVAGNVVNAVDPSGMIYETPYMWDSCASGNDFPKGGKGDKGKRPTPPSSTPTPPPTPSPSPVCDCYSSTPALRDYCRSGIIADCSGSNTDDAYTADAIAVAEQIDQNSCLQRWVSREVGTGPGSGASMQAQAITWVILNRLAITIHVRRAMLNIPGVNWGNVCGMASLGNAPSESVSGGIETAIINYGYRSDSDPTDGSLQWRHYPNCGKNQYGSPGCTDEWPADCNYPKDSVCIKTNSTNRPSETSVEFFRRFRMYAEIYETNNPGRNNFDANIVSEVEAERYDGQLYQLGALSTFNRDTTNSSANIYTTLGNQ